MGRTARKTKSPYAAANRRNSAHRDTSGDTTIVYQRRRNEDSLPVPLSPDMERVANTVTERMISELQSQIAQAIEAVHRSPRVSTTPSTDQQATSSGINSNVINMNLMENYDGGSVSPVTSFNDDLGMHVSQQLRDKIINGEYIELESLLENAHEDHPKNIVVDNKGNLSLKQKSGKRIVDINTWIDAFLTYTSIYTTAHPSSTQGLLKYIFNIKLGASRCAGQGWLNYDRQFRIKRARNLSTNWGAVDMELWLLYISQGQTPAKESQISLPTLGKCFTYNNKGRCGRQTCPYRHRCLKCGGPHAAIFCTLTKSGSNLKSDKWSVKADPAAMGDFQKDTFFQNNRGFRFRTGKSSPARRTSDIGIRKNANQGQ